MIYWKSESRHKLLDNLINQLRDENIKDIRY
jgi:hypothetical protein